MDNLETPPGPYLFGLTKGLFRQAWETCMCLNAKLIPWGVESREINLKKRGVCGGGYIFQNQIKQISNLIRNYISAKIFHIISFIQLFSAILYSRIHTFCKWCGWHVTWNVAVRPYYATWMNPNQVDFVSASCSYYSSLGHGVVTSSKSFWRLRIGIRIVRYCSFAKSSILSP